MLSLPALVVDAAGPLARLVPDPVAPGWAAWLDGALLLFWGATIAIALGVLLRSAVRLRRERRGWTPATVDGQEVLLAEERGPTVVGLPESAPRALARYQNLPAGERPLVVVDGEIRSLSAADVRTLDPGDIERVEIIKGQAALGLYGEEARNGAIVITTKQRQRNRR